MTRLILIFAVLPFLACPAIAQSEPPNHDNGGGNHSGSDFNNPFEKVCSQAQSETALGRCLNDKLKAVQNKKICSDVRSQVELGRCLNTRLEKVRKDMNHILSEIKNKIPKNIYYDSHNPQEWIGDLKSSQKKWQRYIEADCDSLLIHEHWMGNGVSDFISICRLKKSYKRLISLATRYHFAIIK